MNPLFCGFAQADITPVPNTVFMDGYGSRMTPAEGMRDPLYAKVCVIGSGEEIFAVVNLDICGFGGGLAEHLRRWVRTLTGLENHQFALCATHTHAGPACGVLHELPINWLYWNRVGELVAKAIEDARKTMCEGAFRFAFGTEITQAINRRGRDIIDRRIPVCAFYDRRQRLRGVIASASCHAVCNTDMHLTADYPAIITKVAAERYPGIPFLFLQGRGADINPYSWEVGGMPPYENLGAEVANSIFAALGHMTGAPLQEGGVRSVFRRVSIPMGYPPREELTAELDSIKQQILSTPMDTDRRELGMELNWYSKALEQTAESREHSIVVSLQMVAIGGSFVMAFVPFELWTSTGNAIEKELLQHGIQAGHGLVVGYANGTNGYLASSAESGQSGYETLGAAHWYGLPNCKAESEKSVLRELSNMADELLGQ